MIEMPRVLIGTPIYEGKEYCRKQFVENVKQFTYPNATLMVVDNSCGTSYTKKLRMDGLNVHHVARGRNSRDALQNSMNVLRKRALEGGYDYLFMLESDLFPQKDIIERLMAHMDVTSLHLQDGKRVVGAPYHIGFKKDRRLCVFKIDPNMNQGLGGTTPLKPGDEEWFLNGELWNVHGMGVGCTLIHRSILEEFSFWYSELDDDRMKHLPIRKHPDVYFYLDLHNAKIRVWCDSSLYTHHQNSDWRLVKDM